MKKIKVAEATNIQLDWLVATIEFPPGSYGGEAEHYSGNRNERWVRIPNKAERCYDLARYTTNPAQMWPIIEREDIAIGHGNSKAHPDNRYEAAIIRLQPWAILAQGPTKLIAVARCYVVSKLGEEVEVPEELT